MQDPYKVLGVERNASQQDVKRAYRALALENHPDRNDDPSAEEKFKGISEAYSILSNEVARREYDSAFIDQQHPRRGFNDFFSGFNSGNPSWEDLFGNSPEHRTRQYIVRAHLEVSLEDIARSVRKSFILDGQSVEFKLPATVRPDQVIPIRLPQGQELHITIKLAHHPVFTLREDDLYCIIDVPVETAISGGHVRVPTLDGSTNLKVPLGTNSHCKLRVRSAGLALSTGGKSSIIYEVRIDTKNISEALRQFLY